MIKPFEELKRALDDTKDIKDIKDTRARNNTVQAMSVLTGRSLPLDLDDPENQYNNDSTCGKPRLPNNPATTTNTVNTTDTAANGIGIGNSSVATQQQNQEVSELYGDGAIVERNGRRYMLVNRRWVDVGPAKGGLTAAVAENAANNANSVNLDPTTFVEERMNESNKAASAAKAKNESEGSVFDRQLPGALELTEAKSPTESRREFRKDQEDKAAALQDEVVQQPKPTPFYGEAFDGIAIVLQISENRFQEWKDVLAEAKAEYQADFNYDGFVERISSNPHWHAYVRFSATADHGVLYNSKKPLAPEVERYLLTVFWDRVTRPDSPYRQQNNGI